MATQSCTHWITEPFFFLHDISMTVINVIMDAIPALQASCHFGRVQPLHIKPCPMQWCPRMRQDMLAQGPLHRSHCCSSQQLLHPTLLLAWAYCPSQTLGIKLWLCQTRLFLLLHCWPLWNIFPVFACDEGILTFWKSWKMLVLLLPVIGFPRQCCSFLICCARIVLAALLKKLVNAEMNIWAVFCRTAL